MVEFKKNVGVGVIIVYLRVQLNLNLNPMERELHTHTILFSYTTSLGRLALGGQNPTGPAKNFPM